MGIRFNTDTWRAPLQLIDSWLPVPPVRPTSHRQLPHAVRRFARAGWLRRETEAARPSAEPSTLPSLPTSRTVQSPGRVRVARATEAAGTQRMHDARLVISGRINDVCAELDRLVALELQRNPTRA